MILQKIIKEKINNFGGTQLLIENLDKIQYMVTSDDRCYINSLSINYSALEHCDIPLIKDTIERKQIIERQIDLLGKIDDNDKTISFIVELLKFQLEYIKGVRQMFG